MSKESRELDGTLWGLYIRLQEMIERDGVDPTLKIGFEDPVWGWVGIKKIESDGYSITLSEI